MVIAEKPKNHTELDASSPTTLHLFRLKEPDRLVLQSRIPAIEQFTNYARGTFEFVERFKNTVDKRKDRLSQTSKELAQQIFNLNSSATCSTVFLKMQEEFDHLSPPELMDFFRLCLRINMKVFQHFVGGTVTSEDRESSFRKALVRTNNSRNNALTLKTIVDSMAGDSPAWFKDSKKTWDQFLRMRFPFSLYLNPEFIPNLDSAYSQKNLEKLINYDLGYVVAGEYPDWLDDNQTIPTKKAVQQELSEDLGEVTRIIQEEKKITYQQEYIKDNFTHKTEKAKKWLDMLVQKIFPAKNLRFLDQILVLYLISSMSESQEKKGKPLDPRNSFEETVQELAHSQGLVSKSEQIALFMEKTMIKSGIIKSAQTPIDGQFVALFNMLFKSIEKKSKEFANLKEENKKLFKALNYDIKPLLEIMTPDEIFYLLELLEEYKGYAVEPFIWDIAESASSHFKKEESEDKEKLKTKITQFLGKSTASFLRNNWKWAYNQLKKSLSLPNAQFVPISPAETFDQIETASSLNASEVQQELTSSIKEIQKGNLSGWKIFYTTNMSPDPKYLVEIRGETIDEREEELEKFFIKEGVGHSIKTASIVHVLDGIPVFSEEFKRTRSKKIINGVTFGKTKRGAGRMFDIADYEKKTITFFYYQKKAYNYNF